MVTGLTAVAGLQTRLRFPGCTQPRHRSAAAVRVGRRSLAVQSFLDKTKEGGPRDLVVAVDATEASRAGLAWTVNHLYRVGDCLHVLHVIPYHTPAPSFPGSTVYVPETEADHQKQMRMAKKFVTNTCERIAHELGVDEVRVELVEEPCDESIGQAIIHRVDEIDADMLVVMSHEKNPVQELLMGSVSKYVIAKSHCPTVLLPEMMAWPDADALTDDISVGLVD